jgi:hypothetical protein
MKIDIFFVCLFIFLLEIQQKKNNKVTLKRNIERLVTLSQKL